MNIVTGNDISEIQVKPNDTINVSQRNDLAVFENDDGLRFTTEKRFGATIGEEFDPNRYSLRENSDDNVIDRSMAD